MTAVRKRTRGLAAASAVTLMLGLAACGGGDDDKKESSGKPTQDSSVKFTGDPVTVMTISTYDTDTLNAKVVLDIAQGAVVQINNAGGYLRSLTDRAKEGQFSTWPMVMALLRAKLDAQGPVDKQDGGRSYGEAEAGDRLQVSDSLLKSLQRPKSR